MKKLSVLLLSVLFVSFSFMSCSSDDDSSGGSGNVNLIGSWEFSKSGFIVEGNEFLDDYDHWAPECGLDHIVFNSNNTGLSVEFDEWNGECEEDEEAFEWSLENNVLVIEEGDNFIEFEVVELTGSTLRIQQETEILDEAYTLVIILKKM